MACQVGFYMKEFVRSSPVHPEKERRERAKKNLFGSPKQGSIDKLFKEENEKQKKEFDERFIIEIDKTYPICDRQQRKELPHLIAMELKNHEEQGRQQKCNSKCANVSNNSDQDDDGSNNVTYVKNPAELKPNADDPVNNKVLKSNCERHKSNKKQQKLTNYYYVRKAPREDIKMLLTAGPLQELSQLKRATMSSNPVVSAEDAEVASPPVVSSQLK